MFAHDNGDRKLVISRRWYDPGADRYSTSGRLACGLFWSASRILTSNAGFGIAPCLHLGSAQAVLRWDFQDADAGIRSDEIEVHRQLWLSWRVRLFRIYRGARPGPKSVLRPRSLRGRNR